MPVLRVLPLPPGRIHCAAGCQVGRSSRPSCKGSVWQPPWIPGFLESPARGVSADLAIRPHCCSRSRRPQHLYPLDPLLGPALRAGVSHTCAPHLSLLFGGWALSSSSQGPASPVGRSRVPPGSGRLLSHGQILATPGGHCRWRPAVPGRPERSTLVSGGLRQREAEKLAKGGTGSLC